MIEVDLRVINAYDHEAIHAENAPLEFDFTRAMPYIVQTNAQARFSTLLLQIAYKPYPKPSKYVHN